MEDSKSLMDKNNERMSPEVESFNKKISEALDRSIDILEKSALKEQVGGNHYKDFAIQPIEFIHKNGIGFIEGNIIKYVCRHKNKNGLEDLKKARHYLDILIEMYEKE